MDKVLELEVNGGIKVILKDPTLNRYHLEFRWKAIGSEKYEKNEHSKDGFFNGANFLKHKKEITFILEVIPNIVLSEDVYKDILSLEEKMRKDKNNLINKTVDDIISGENPLNLGIVGSGYPHYQPWIYNIPSELKGEEQDLMEKAINRLLPDTYVSNSCEFIERILNSRVTTKENINKKAFNLKFDKKVQDYYEFNRNVVTSFEIKLVDVLEETIKKNKIELEEKKRIKLEKEKQKKEDFLGVKEFLEKEYSDTTAKEFGYIYKITFETGKSYTFVDRNIHDFGRVINPNYEIEKGISGGLIEKKENGEAFWKDFQSGKGWIRIRKLYEDELKAYTLVEKYGNGSTEVRTD